MIGTTLSITNVGPFGVDAAIPILPPGTGAILAVGQIAKAPWVVDDQVVVRQVVELAMAFDHRQVDGAMASAVLAHIGRFLHDPPRQLSPAKPAVREVRRAICQRGCSCSTHC